MSIFADLSPVFGGSHESPDFASATADATGETPPMMLRRPRLRPAPARFCLAALGLALFSAGLHAAEPNFPITPQQRSTAQQVAQSGVPLSELAPNAPDSYTIKRGDTLWDISKLFLRSPWRWPELWGMNLDQIRNPHLIFPGQILVLEKIDGRARLRVGQPVTTDTPPADTVKLSPRVRVEGLDTDPIASVPMHLIAPFLEEAVVFNTNELAAAPRIVAAPEGRVMMSRGENAYVRGDLGGRRDFRVFREATPLRDPSTKEILGYEARYLGTAEFVRQAESRDTNGKALLVPATFVVTGVRQEMGVGDRLAPVPPRDFSAYVPHAPGRPLAGQIISIYGDSLTAGQNQIVSLNKGAADGMERGHVLALWRDGTTAIDSTDPSRPQIKLPDERHGLLFVFRVFDRVSYALILNVQDPVRSGDRFSQP
jgi:hypothetical protein